MQPDDRFVREQEACKITGLSRTTRWRLETKGQFPPRRRISARCTGWLMSEIQDWLREREMKPFKHELELPPGDSHGHIEA